MKIVSYFTLLLVVLLTSSSGNPVPSLPDEKPERPTATTFVPGPDLIVGDLPALQQFGSSGTQVGLALRRLLAMTETRR